MTSPFADWKGLVQFAMLGSSDLEQYAILLVRVLLGLFYAISGAIAIVEPIVSSSLGDRIKRTLVKKT